MSAVQVEIRAYRRSDTREHNPNNVQSVAIAGSTEELRKLSQQFQEEDLKYLAYYLIINNCPELEPSNFSQAIRHLTPPEEIHYFRLGSQN